MADLFTNLWHLSIFVFLLPFLYAAALVMEGTSAAIRFRAWRRGVEPNDRFVSLAASALFWIALILAGAAIVERYIEAGRPPFKTLYESLVLFAFTTNLVYVAIDVRYRHPFLGVPAAGLLLGICVYAAAKADVEIVDLPAALQSGWFIPHVVVYLLGYGALAVGAVAALGSLIFPEFKLFFRSASKSQRQNLSFVMDRLNVFGFVLISFGLIMGAVWAKEAWGDWWSWDPKENWSLITWLVYIFYFHVRRLSSWSGRRMAIVTLVGFGAVMFTYLGMNVLPTAEMSEHVYQ